MLANTFKGSPVQVGNGKVRSFISINHADQPIEIGLEIDDAALYGLPTNPGDFAASTFHIPFNQRVLDMTAFNHLVLNWNVHGHKPMQVFDVPHFDFHFYMISRQDQEAIPPYAMASANHDWLPPMGYRPSMYFATPGGVPQMGKHWVDGFYTPPFTHTMVYGSYNGKFTFVEPMVTRALLLQGNSYSVPYRQPAAYLPDQTYYPTMYNVYKNAATSKHYVSLSNFVWR